MRRNKWVEIAKVFFKLGCTAFGGPAAHIAMMDEEIVKKRKWISSEYFLDLIGATNLIPGPNSTEMTMHCGHERGGRLGLFIAGFCFIFPAVTITMLLAWLYHSYGQLPHVLPFIYGIKPAVIAIIIAAVYRLGKKALKTPVLGVLGVLTLVACLLGVHEIIALFCCAFVSLMLASAQQFRNKANSVTALILLQPIVISKLKTGLIFLKVGALLYGGGYVLFSFLDAELVDTGVLTRQELMDAVAVGQFTPGPVLSTATFIGWQLNGFWGALLATVGVFLPSFIFVMILNPIIPKLRKSSRIAAFLDGANIAAVAVIVGTCMHMGANALSDWKTITIALISTVVVFVFKQLNSAFIVLGASLLGYIFYLVS